MEAICKKCGAIFVSDTEEFPLNFECFCNSKEFEFKKSQS